MINQDSLSKLEPEQVISKYLLTKYGYALDMFLLFKPFDNIDMQTVINAFNGIILKGGLTIYKETTFDDYIQNSYSGYIRRFIRTPRSTIYNHYKEELGDKYKLAHRALIADRPIFVDNESDFIEVEGGTIDNDSLSAPGYLTINKVKIENNLTAIKINYNSELHRKVWSDMLNINMILGAYLTKVYNTDGIYGRTTSLLSSMEHYSRFTSGKLKKSDTGKGVLKDALLLENISINKLMDAYDMQMGTHYADHEIYVINKAIDHLLGTMGVLNTKVDLISDIEKVVAKKSIQNGHLPSLTAVKKYVSGYIEDVLQLSNLTLEELKNIPDIEDYVVQLTRLVLGYVRYYTYLFLQSDVDVKYFIVVPAKHKRIGIHTNS